MSIAYDSTLALTFANAVQAAYNFYDNQTPIALAGYTIGANIYVYELGEQTFFGYVATGAPPQSGIPTHNLVVFRGTRTTEEGIYDLDWTMTTCTLGDAPRGQAAKGQYDFYTGGLFETSLAKSVRDAVDGFADPSLPLYVCGHSLGGGIATLAALDLWVSQIYTAAQPILYTYGGLHVGDAAFVDVFAASTAAAFRVVNLADFVPQITGAESDNLDYLHVGEQWWFLSYGQYLWHNHELAISYLSAVTSHADQITNASPPLFATLLQPAIAAAS